MPKPALLALPLAALTVALTLPSPTPSSVTATTSNWPAANVLAHPSQWVIVSEATPYTVPAGTTFVVTGVGTTGAGQAGNAPASAFADGAPLVKSVLGSPGGWGPSSVLALDVPLPVDGGTVLSVQSSNGNGRLWGYAVRPGGGTGGTFELPPAWEWIELAEGAPYVVPAGKLLVLTALNRSMGGTTGACYLEIDGVREVAAYAPAGFSANLARLAPGLAARPGQVVEPVDQDGAPPEAGRAWGFLVDER